MAESDVSAETSPLPRDIVLFSTADWDHPFWTNKQRVAVQLAQSGFRVLYIESLGLRRPTATTRDIRRIWRRLRRSTLRPRQVQPNLWVGAPTVIPLHACRGVSTLNDWLLTGTLRRWMKQLGFGRPIVWTYNPLVRRVGGAIRGSLVVYHAVDDLGAVPGVPIVAVRVAQEDLARRADVVFTTSPALRAQLSPLAPGRTHFLPNVADYEHFARARLPGALPADLAAIPSPRIGFVGAISPYKVDFAWIAQIAARRPDLHWVLVGQLGEGQPHASDEQLRLPNIHLLGPRAYDELPDYLRGFDVAAIPAPSNAYTAAMFPMKFFEYLSAGRPVVACGVPALASFSDACALVKSPSEFEVAIDRCLRGQIPDAAHCDALARRYTWQWRIGEMLALLESAWKSKDCAYGRRHSAADSGLRPVFSTRRSPEPSQFTP